MDQIKPRVLPTIEIPKEETGKKFMVSVMACPRCGVRNSRVCDKRFVERSDSIRRRRQCQECKTVFTTVELTLEGLGDFLPALEKFISRLTKPGRLNGKED